MILSDHLKIELPQSPHIESYKKFRNDLPVRLKTWLTELIDNLRRKGKLNFEPALTLNPDSYDGTFPSSGEEKECQLNSKTLAVTVVLPITRIIKTQQDPWNWVLGQLPQMTSRGSFIFASMGENLTTERCLIAQLAKSPGVFFHWKETNEPRGPMFCKIRYAEAVIRPERGVHFFIRREVEPDQGPLRIVFPNKDTARLSTFLEALDFSNQEQKVIFHDALDLFEDIVHDRNKISADRTKKQDVSHIAACMGLGKWLEDENLSIAEEDKARIRAKIQEKLYASSFGELGRAQINRKIKRIDHGYSETSQTMTKGDVAGILKALIGFMLIRIPADDPWDLGNLKVRLVGDYLDAAIDHWCNWMRIEVRRLVEGRIDEKGGKPLDAAELMKILDDANLDESGMSHFTHLINRWMINSPMSQFISADRNNLLEAASLTQKVSFSGWGGVAIGHEREPRDFHWSHYGRLCPLETPQTNEVGTNLSFAVGARVNPLGIIETACYPVTSEDGVIKVGDEQCWISSWNEASGEGDNWIAFPDQREDLIAGKKVEAHQGSVALKMVEASLVKYIHCTKQGMYGIAANLIPYIQHNDSVRGVMGCSFMKQALPLKNATSPRVKTGFEKLIPEKYPFASGLLDKQEMAYGKELLVAYIPWKGWNFEDAFAVSQSASLKLTSLEQKKVTIKLRRSMEKQKEHFTSIVKMKQKLPSQINLDSYDKNGVIKEGEIVSAGDYLVLESKGRKTNKKSFQFISHIVQRDVKGTVTSIEEITTGNGPSIVQIIITQERIAAIGDKLANRHGHKGVISKVFADHEMPYFLLTKRQSKEEQSCPCGEKTPHSHFELLINPITVLSRMNIGQLNETFAARRKEFKGYPEKVNVFDPSAAEESDRILKNKIFWGEQYIMRLDHDAIDKVHARSRVASAYSSFVEQPLKGRHLKGGQRLGEMEVWSLMAHNASGIMNELLTLKSDNPRERKMLFMSILQGKNKEPKSRLPEAFRTVAAFLMGLGVEMSAMTKKGLKINPLIKQCDPDDVSSIQLSLLNPDDYVKYISMGEVKTAVTSGRSFHYKYHPASIESWQIFGPEHEYSCACGLYEHFEGAVGKNMICNKCKTPLIPSYQRRLRMGHIKLAKSVPNPFLLMMADNDFWLQNLGLEHSVIQSILEDKPKISFKSLDTLTLFLNKAINASVKFKAGIERKINSSLLPDEYPKASSWKPSDLETLRALLKKMVAESGGLDLKAFMQKANQRYRRRTDKQVILGLSGLITAVIIEEEISERDLVNDILKLDSKTKYLCMDILPVIPPNLRKRFQIPGKFKSHDLTILYKKVLRANTNLEQIEALPDSDPNKTSKYEHGCRALQEAVTQLFCNEKLPPAARAIDYSLPQRSPYTSLSSYLEGKEGLITGNLLGKRVDFSGRTVIVPDPLLKMDQCKLPLKIALTLFYPHIISSLSSPQKGQETEERKKLINSALLGDNDAMKEIEPILINIMKSYDILLNRQPTLHRLGLLSFKASLTDESAIALSPLVTKGFNADFDGDQMAVYVPLTEETRKELSWMRPSVNIWHPANGRYALSLAQDITLGEYLIKKHTKSEIAKKFEDIGKTEELQDTIEDCAKKAFEASAKDGVSFSPNDFYSVSDLIPRKGTDQIEEIKQVIKRQSDDNSFKNILFSGAGGKWENMPNMIGTVYPERNKSNLAFGLKYGEQLLLAAGGRRNLVDTKLSTAEGGALTKDFVYLAQDLWITEEDCQTDKFIPVDEYEEFWVWAEDKSGAEIENILNAEINKDNNDEQEGVTGVLMDTLGYGRPSDWELLPEGESYDDILKNHPARIPPRLIGLRIQRKIGSNEERKQILFNRLYGRILASAYDPFPEGTQITKSEAEAIAEKIMQQRGPAFIRSPLTCDAEFGICQKCYGLLLSTSGNQVSKWEDDYLASFDTRVGIIAAQAVGEPGTQMALGKKHLSFSTAKQETSMGINDVKRCIQEKYMPWIGEQWIMRDTLDHYYRSQDITIACIHFEVLARGMFKSRDVSWIARLERDKGTLNVLATSSLENLSDEMQGLKEHALIGSHLPTVEVES